MGKRVAADKTDILFASLVCILVVVFGTIAVVAQQIQRDDADYPQVQLAEDAAASLNSGDSPAQLTSGHVNMNSSLAPFVIIYSKTGQPVAGNGFLANGHGLPTVPSGVLTAARGKAYHFVTWQPESDVRIAAVTVASNNYYVLSGRSLQEVEKNTDHTFWLSFAGGCMSIVVLAGGYMVARKL